MKRFLPYIGPIIGLIGVSLALYFHAEAVQERVPTYYVSPQRATIVDASGPSPSDLQVLYRGKRVGSTSVTAVIVFIWNDGKQPIRSNDILEPVKIELSDQSSEILEARLLKVSRPVINFAKKDINENAKNSLSLSFDILEKSDGAAIQIIYAGNPGSTISVKGTIVGAGTPRALTGRSDRWFAPPSPRESLRIATWGGYGLVALGLAMAIAMSFRIWWRARTGLRISHLTYSAVFVSILYVGAGILYIHYVRKASSPGVPATIWIER